MVTGVVVIVAGVVTAGPVDGATVDGATEVGATEVGATRWPGATVDGVVGWLDPEHAATMDATAPAAMISLVRFRR